MSVWNRRKEEEFTVRPTSGPPAPSELAKEGIPMSTLPGRASDPHHDVARTAVLGKSVIVKGQIFSREDLTIDGEVEGTVELQEHRLTIGPNGKGARQRQGSRTGGAGNHPRRRGDYR